VCEEGNRKEEGEEKREKRKEEGKERKGKEKKMEKKLKTWKFLGKNKIKDNL
jgi:hypothetical protein